MFVDRCLVNLNLTNQVYDSLFSKHVPNTYVFGKIIVEVGDFVTAIMITGEKNFYRPENPDPERHISSVILPETIPYNLLKFVLTLHITGKTYPLRMKARTLAELS